MIEYIHSLHERLKSKAGLTYQKRLPQNNVRYILNPFSFTSLFSLTGTLLNQGFASYSVNNLCLDMLSNHLKDFFTLLSYYITDST